jgi:hypothetical protein
MINALAPGMLSALARAEGQKLKWMQIGGAGSKRVKDLDAEIASIHEKLDPILQNVMQGKGTPQPSDHGAPSTNRASQSVSAPQAKSAYSHFANDGKGNRIGYNSTTNRWEPVGADQR